MSQQHPSLRPLRPYSPPFPYYAFPIFPPWSPSPEPGDDYRPSPVNVTHGSNHPFTLLTEAAQLFDSLPRLSSPSLFLPEASTSYSQEEQPPPSNQQAPRLPSLPSVPRYRDSVSPFRSPNALPPLRTLTHTTRESSVVDLTESSPTTETSCSESMAPSRKRKAATPGNGRPSKATRSSVTTRDLGATPVGEPVAESLDMVDLVDVDDDAQYENFKAKQQAELIKQQQQEEASRPVKLVEFQCIICMDNPTDLSVTHCGHLFCSECLHQALYAGTAKKCCPVCRTMISTTLQGKDKKQPKNGIFALEMKLMTANKKGKQPAKVVHTNSPHF